VAGDARAAVARRQQRRQDAESRGLPSAVWAEETEDLARLDRERDAVDRGDLVEADDEVVDEDGGLGVGRERVQWNRFLTSTLGYQPWPRLRAWIGANVFPVPG
jgi:hypothetical protein